MKLEEEIVLRGTLLRLNGYGVRIEDRPGSARGRPTRIGHYTAALYLGGPARTSEAALSMPGAKRLSLTMLRDTDTAELDREWHDELIAQIESHQLPSMLPGVLRLGELLSRIERLEAGDAIVLDWLPEVGTCIAVRERVVAQPIRDEAFFQALMRIWIGPRAIDPALRRALLDP